MKKNDLKENESLLNPYIFQEYSSIKKLLSKEIEISNLEDEIIIVHDLFVDWNNPLKIRSEQELRSILEKYLKIPFKLVSIEDTFRIDYSNRLVFYFIHCDWNIKEDFRNIYSKTFPFNFEEIYQYKKSLVKKLSKMIINQYNPFYNPEGYIKRLVSNIFKLVFHFTGDFELTTKKVLKSKRTLRDIQFRQLNFYASLILDKSLSLKEKFILTLLYNAFLFNKMKFRKYYSEKDLCEILYSYSGNRKFEFRSYEKGEGLLKKEILNSLVENGYLIENDGKYRLLTISEFVIKKGFESKKTYFTYGTRYWFNFPIKYQEFVDKSIIFLLEKPNSNGVITKARISEYLNLSISQINNRIRKMKLILQHKFLELSKKDYVKIKTDKNLDSDRNDFLTVLANDGFYTFTKFMGFSKTSKSYWFRIYVNKGDDKTYKYSRMRFTKKWNVDRYNNFKFVSIKLFDRNKLQIDGILNKDLFSKGIDVEQERVILGNLKHPRKSNKRNADNELLHRNTQNHSLLFSNIKSFRKIQNSSLRPYKIYSVYTNDFYSAPSILKKVVYVIANLQLSYFIATKKQIPLKKLLSLFEIANELKKIEIDTLKKKKIFSLNKKKLVLDYLNKSMFPSQDFSTISFLLYNDAKKLSRIYPNLFGKRRDFLFGSEKSVDLYLDEFKKQGFDRIEKETYQYFVSSLSLNVKIGSGKEIQIRHVLKPKDSITSKVLRFEYRKIMTAKNIVNTILLLRYKLQLAKKMALISKVAEIKGAR